MIINAHITITRNGVSYDQTTGRRTEETPIPVVENIPCLISLTKARRVPYSDGVREMVKVLYPASFQYHGALAIHPGDIATVTMKGEDEPLTFTVEDAIKSIGIRMKRWKLDLERIKTPVENG